MALVSIDLGDEYFVKLQFYILLQNPPIPAMGRKSEILLSFPSSTMFSYQIFPATRILIVPRLIP